MEPSGTSVTSDATLPLFDGVDPLSVIDRDLAAWRKVCDLAETQPKFRREGIVLHGLARDLRALRDYYVAARHPRVRAALLREAGAVSRRMREKARRLRIRGVTLCADGVSDARDRRRGEPLVKPAA